MNGLSAFLHVSNDDPVKKLGTVGYGIGQVIEPDRNRVGIRIRVYTRAIRKSHKKERRIGGF